MIKLTAISNGQTPRDDFMGDLVPLLPSSMSVTHVGALDTLTPEQVKTELVPSFGEETLVVRLNTGDVLDVSKARTIPLIQKAINKAADDGADAIIQLCTLPFPPFESKIPFISPYDHLHSIVPAIAHGLKVGILFPYESHAPAMEKTWKAHGINMVTRCLAPAVATGEAIAKLFEGENIALLVLDCIGFTTVVRDDAQKIMGIPVLQPKQMMVNMLKTLF